MNKITINGIELELTDEQAAGLVEQYKAKQGDFPQHGELYHFVDSGGGISCIHFSGDIFDKWRKSIGNCFRTRFEVDDIKYPGEGITLLERVANIIGVQTRKHELAALKMLKGMVGDA
jgi:hypothetical protein